MAQSPETGRPLVAPARGAEPPVRALLYVWYVATAHGGLRLNRHPTPWLALVLTFVGLGVMLSTAAGGAHGMATGTLMAPLPTAAPASVTSGSSSSGLGSLTTPYGSFMTPSTGCTTGINGTCPHLTPSVSAFPSTICRSGSAGCGAIPYDTKVTLTVNATGDTLSSPPNVQVVFVVETTLFDGVYDPLAGEPGLSSCSGPCAESNGVPFFVANAGQIATDIATHFGASLSSCTPGGQNSVCFAMVDYFSTTGADHDDGDGSEYHPDVTTFVPANQFQGAVASSFQSFVLGGGWVYGDSDFSDNILSSSSITGVYGAERGSGLAWNANADHVIVWMGSTVPRDPNYVSSYAPTDSNFNSGNSASCEPPYFGGQPNCYGWAEPTNSIAAYAKANNIVIDTIDLPDGMTELNAGDYLSTGTAAQADVKNILQAGCDMAVATGGSWEGPQGFPCSAAATGTGQGNLTCVSGASCESRGAEYNPARAWGTNPGLGWALTNINFPSISSNVTAKGTTGETFNFIPAPYFQIDPGNPNYKAVCSTAPTSPPLPVPCSSLPQWSNVGSLGTGVGWAWPDNTMYLGDKWSVSFNVIATAAFPTSMLKIATPIDACVGAPTNPWSGLCKTIAPGSGPAAYSSLEYTTYAGTTLTPAQSFPPAFVTVVNPYIPPPPPPSHPLGSWTQEPSPKQTVPE